MGLLLTIFTLFVQEKRPGFGPGTAFFAPFWHIFGVFTRDPSPDVYPFPGPGP